MLKAVQCDGCGHAFTVAKLAEQQQVSCPACNGLIFIPSSGIDKNTIVGNRYQIKEILEESPVSTLYIATDLDYEDYALLRVYSWGFSNGVTSLEDFLHTITSVSHLAEPVHIHITDQGIDDGQIYTVWPYEDMESVDSIVNRNGPMSPAMAVSICKDLALSLDKAFHTTGAGHYNLTPKCLYMNSQGAVRYSDYGISAHLSNDQRFIQSGFPLWNMHYLSPEMALGWSYPDIKSDMYALASVLYFMVSGAEPYAGARSVQEINHDSLQFPSSVQKDLSRSFEDFFYSMTARNPIQRFNSWSEAVSKMDQFLFEEKSQKKSAVSQRQRASLTKVHQQESFDSIKLNPNDRKKKLTSSKSQGFNKKRMSAEDVRSKLAQNDGGKPAMSFARNSPSKAQQAPSKSSKSLKMKSSTGSRSKGPKSAGATRSPGTTRGPGARGATGARTKAALNRTGSHAAVQKKKQAPPPPKKSKTTAVLVILGIVFGLMVIGFIVFAALGKNKKPKLATDPSQDNNESVDNSDYNKAGKERTAENKVEDNKKPDSDKDDPDPVVKKPDPEPKEVVTKDPSRFNELIALIRKGVADRGSNPVELQGYFDEAYPLSDGVKDGKKQLDALFKDFEPRRALAKRLAYNEVFQTVRNMELKRDFDGALAYIDKYDGPFSDEIQAELASLKEKTLKNKEKAANEPPPEMKDGKVVKTDEQQKEEAANATVEEVSVDDLAEKIAKAQTSIALILYEKVKEKLKDKSASIEPLKPILENAEEAKINGKIIEGFKKLINTNVSLINKGQKMSGKLLAVDEEDNDLSIAVNFNGRTLNRVVKLDDVHISNKLPLIVGENEVETVLLQTIYMIRANDLIGSLKHFDKYNGPLKTEIRKFLLKNLNGDAIGALSKVLELTGLSDIAGDQFEQQLAGIKVNSEDAWLASYLVNRFKVNFSSTEYYINNEEKINALSKILNKMASRAKSPSVIVSENGGNGTETLENALREAKSGAIIRILPGVYEGSLEIRQRSVSLYGASGVVINAALRVSESRCILKQLTFTNGHLSLSNKVGSVDIINCLFTKDGINLTGDNSGVTITNSVIYGIQAGENKRTKINHCTILERKDRNQDNSFTIRGYINGEIKNSIIYAERNYVIRFNESQKSSCAFKDSLLFGGNSLAMVGNERISDISSFKKEVGRVSDVITDKPEFLEPVGGDYRLKDFSPGFLAGEDKKSMGVQMDTRLQLIDVK